MRNPFQKRTTTASIEIEKATLSKRRSEVAGRIAAVGAALDAAKLERRETLSSDGDFAGLTTKIRELTIESTDLEALIVDIDAQIADASARLATARDAEARAASALALEKIASDAELRVPEIEKAAAVFAKAISGLKADLGDSIGFWPSHNATRPEGSIDERKDKATAREVAAGIVAELLAKQMPWLFETVGGRDGYRSSLSRILDPRSPQRNWVAEQPTAPLSAAEIMESLVCAPLRDHALAIKDGTADIEKPRQAAVVDNYVRPSAPANVSVFVTRAFTYVGSEFGGLEVVPDGWVRNVPEPVANIAEARDLCVRATSPRGEALLAASKERKGSSDIRVRPEDCVELGDVLRFRIAREERAEVRRALG